MATAGAAALRPLLRHTAASPKPDILPLPTTQFHLPKTQLPHLQIKASLPVYRLRPAFSAANNAYSDTDQDYDEDQFSEEEDDNQPVSSLTSPAAATGDNRRLYVGNLAYSMTSSQLSEVFTQAGSVISVEIVTDRVTDRSRGFGFVTMASEEEASNAIRMYDGALVGGRTVKVNFPEVPRGGEREVLGPRMRRGSAGFTDSPYKVYAGNLGWTVTSESLRDAFSGQPGLLSAKVVYNRDSGLSRGFGFLSFASPEEAQAAIDNMNEKEVGGRPLRLSLAAGSPGTGRPREQLSEVEF